MKLKEIAKAFDMNINEFSELTGYTTQGLHAMQSPNKDKMAAMLERLRKRSDLLYRGDIAIAVNRKRLRQQVIDFYAAKLEGRGGENEG